MGWGKDIKWNTNIYSHFKKDATDAIWFHQFLAFIFKLEIFLLQLWLLPSRKEHLFILSSIARDSAKLSFSSLLFFSFFFFFSWFSSSSPSKISCVSSHTLLWFKMGLMQSFHIFCCQSISFIMVSDAGILTYSETEIRSSILVQVFPILNPLPQLPSNFHFWQPHTQNNFSLSPLILLSMLLVPRWYNCTLYRELF